MTNIEAKRPSDFSGRTLGYVPALDGLRGLAAIAVVLTHYVSPIALGKTPLTFVGGQYGVNMFFVLSGFLITTLLAEEFQRRDRVDLRAFYIRRALRLTPALLAAIAGVIVLGILVDAGVPLGGQGLTATPPPLEGAISWDYLPIAPGIMITIIPIANWAWVAGYYFQPLAVAWTLAIEDQFYLLWPIMLVLLLARLSLKTITILTFTLVAVTIVWRYHLIYTAQWATIRTDFYFTELLLGCGCGLAFTSGMLPTTIALRRVLGVLALVSFGALLIMIAFVAPTVFTMVSGLAGFLTAIIIVYVVIERSSLLASMLAWPPLVGVGLVSYGLYLWHWIWKVWSCPPSVDTRSLGT